MSPALEVDGHCPCCDQDVTFRAEDPWLRDHFRCSHCNSVPRERALIATLDRFFPWWPKATMHERTPGLRGASTRLQQECEHYHATRFFPDRPLGEYTHDGIRNENLMHQTFADGYLDLVVTQDIMERLSNPTAVFREIGRTLKPGGAHVFTTPLVNASRPSERIEQGRSDSPVESGSGFDDGGSLVTMHWGYDIVEQIHRDSGLASTIVFIDDLSLGIRAELNEVIVSRNPASDADA